MAPSENRDTSVQQRTNDNNIKVAKPDYYYGDRSKLDEYLTSVRELEAQLQASQGWERKPKPKVNVPIPVDPGSPAAYMEKVKVMYDLAKVAFQTDSTRAITLMLDSVATPVVEA